MIVGRVQLFEPLPGRTSQIGPCEAPFDFRATGMPCYTGLMPLELVRTAMVVAIPVGHRITATWYAFEKEAFFSSAKTLTPIQEPRIIDHETGIEYDMIDHHEVVSMYVSGEIRQMPPDLLPELKVQGVVTGTVRRCTITKIGGGDGLYHQTTLVVETAQTSSAAYR